ncbi:hypothetical protein [Brevundimonas sp.]|uniref:hypothetical protein n=1 Tax=Brevundimonas sp. TaxID=1871086 RepID=UPI00289CBA2A|nr:hypothetical protein [Brevundimonas sp.]
MTDVTAKRGGVGVRLYVEGGAVVRRTFDQVADSGKKMWAEIALGERAANPAIRALSAGVGEARAGMDGLASRSGAAGAALSAFGFAGVALAAVLGTVALATTAAFEAMGNAAALTDAAERIAVTTERLQEWRYVADEAGVDAGKLESGLEKLNGVMGRFKLGIGDGKLKPVFEELGITKDQLDNIQSSDQLLDVLADTLGQVQDRAQQVALARALGIEELLPILRLGSQELAGLRDEAQDLGFVLSTETVKALDEADRQMERAGQQMKIIRDTAVAPLAGAFADIASQVAGVSVEISNMTGKLPTWGQALTQFAMSLPVVGTGLRGLLYGAARGSGAANKSSDGFVPFVPFDMGSLDIEGVMREPKSGFETLGHTKGGKATGAAAARSRREVEQRLERERRVAERLARAEDDVDRAYDRQSNMTIEGRAASELADLERERAARLRDIARDEEEYRSSNGLRGLTEVEAQQLRLKSQELHLARADAIELEKRRGLAARRLKDEEETARAAVDYLEIESQLAQTGHERYRLEREILVSTQAIARKRREAELANDDELDPDERRRRLGIFDRNAAKQLELFDDREHQRLLERFKGYGREVVDAIEQGRIGEYIGDRIKERLLDGALEQLFKLFEMGGSRGDGAGFGGLLNVFGGSRPNIPSLAGGSGSGGGSGLWSSLTGAVATLFGGPRAGGGETRAGRFYTTVEHGRPELFMIGGQGHVTSAAETARMLKDSLGGGVSSQAAPVVHQPLTLDLRGAVVTQDLIDSANAAAQGAAQTAFDGARQVVPSDRARQDRYTRGRR